MGPRRPACPRARSRSTPRPAPPAPAAFSPFDLTTALTSEVVSLCVGWPVASPPPVAAGPLPNVPTLVINGATDVRTPLEDAHLVRSLIPAAQMLRVPHTGHSTLASDLSDERCAPRAVASSSSASPSRRARRAPTRSHPTPVAPTNFKRLKPTGRGGKVGRTITAALAHRAGHAPPDHRRHLEAGRVPTRAGGLRGGRVVVRNGRVLQLFDVVYVPGVKVSGTVPLRAGARSACASAARRPPAARSPIRRRAITGRIGGRRINVVARARPAAGVRRARLAQARRRYRVRNAG